MLPALPTALAKRNQELNILTQYRAAMEFVRRRQWSSYINAGRAKYQLQKEIRKLKVRVVHQSIGTKFFDHRMALYETWKEKAYRAWEKLEKIQVAMKVLDEAIHINFRQETMIYHKRLDAKV
jgi:hypothetical protein